MTQRRNSELSQHAVEVSRVKGFPHTYTQFSGRKVSGAHSYILHTSSIITH